jgi:hypothetical protein
MSVSRRKKPGAARPACRKKQVEKRPAPASRDGAGRFKKGFSGNPNGKPIVAAAVKELARQYGPEAIQTLVVQMRTGDPQTKFAAARELLNRGYGKPEQAISLPDGPLVGITVNGPVTTLAEATRIYNEALQHPEIKRPEVTFDIPKPAPLEQTVTLEPDGQHVEHIEPAATAAEPPASNVLDRREMWERLGRTSAPEPTPSAAGPEPINHMPGLGKTCPCPACRKK